MKPQGQKLEFVKLRAEGKSYTTISKELHISKSTCSLWEKELKEEVNELKQERLDELYCSYCMHKEARIKRLGKLLNDIDTAIDLHSVNAVPTEKLLELRLKYQKALKEEYQGDTEPFKIDTDRLNAKDIVTALSDLLNRIRAGAVTAEQANKESVVITNLLRAFDTVEVKNKMGAIENLSIGWNKK